MLFVLLVTIHVLVCLFLIAVVLLQSGKAADLAGAFGGMGSQTVFGPRGSATVLTRATTISAIVFMITSLSLSVIGTSATGTAPGSDILDRISAPAQTSAPATPAATPTPAAPATTPAPATPAPAPAK